MGILEALEFLLSNGFKPRRSFYVAFGHDEEVSGLDGAANLAETLKSRGLKKLEFVSDEGTTVVNRVVPGMTKPVAMALSQKPSTNALVRTVTAVTKFNAGVKDNVIPPDAEAIVNHRIHPAQSVQEVIDYDRYIINDDRVKIEVKYSMEPHPMSPHGDEDFAYQVMKNSIRQVWTEAAVAPGVMIGNTDTRHYLQFTNNVYRFSPTFMFPDDLPRFHGINERISKKNYEQAINFYHHLILNADEPALPPLHKHSGEL